MTVLEIFFFLQVMDFMTTLVGLHLGGVEMSPFTSWVMQFGAVGGLTVVKLIGFGLGMLGWIPRLDCWAHYAIDMATSYPWWRHLLPNYLPEVQSTTFRPVQNLLRYVLYANFKLNPTPYFIWREFWRFMRL